MLAAVVQPNNEVVLTSEQVETILCQLRAMRHDVNNHLSVILASVELVRARPDMAERMLNSIAAKPDQIGTAIKTFSAELEKLLRPTAS